MKAHGWKFCALSSYHTGQVKLMLSEIDMYLLVGYQSSHFQLKEGHHLPQFPCLPHLEVRVSGGG